MEVPGLEEHIRDLQRKLGESSKTDQKKLGSPISRKTIPSTQSNYSIGVWTTSSYKMLLVTKYGYG